MNETHCSRCSAQFPPVPASGGASGYAVLPDDSRICYACVDAMQREEIKDQSKPFGAYLSNDGKTITTWTGGKLGDVYQSWKIKLARRSSFLGNSILAIRVRDIHGGLWSGRTSPGLCVNLRPCKP